MSKFEVSINRTKPKRKFIEKKKIICFKNILNSIRTFRLIRSTVFKNIRLAVICMMETKSDECFVGNDEPDFVKISVT